MDAKLFEKKVENQGRDPKLSYQEAGWTSQLTRPAGWLGQLVGQAGRLASRAGWLGHAGQRAGRSGRPAGWPAGLARQPARQAGCRLAWLAGWLAGWLAAWLAGWLACWLALRAGWGWLARLAAQIPRLHVLAMSSLYQDFLLFRFSPDVCFATVSHSPDVCYLSVPRGVGQPGQLGPGQPARPVDRLGQLAMSSEASQQAWPA